MSARRSRIFESWGERSCLVSQRLRIDYDGVHQLLMVKVGERRALSDERRRTAGQRVGDVAAFGDQSFDQGLRSIRWLLAIEGGTGCQPNAHGKLTNLAAIFIGFGLNARQISPVARIRTGFRHEADHVARSAEHRLVHRNVSMVANGSGFIVERSGMRIAGGSNGCECLSQLVTKPGRHVRYRSQHRPAREIAVDQLHQRRDPLASRNARPLGSICGAQGFEFLEPTGKRVSIRSLRSFQYAARTSRPWIVLRASLNRSSAW